MRSRDAFFKCVSCGKEYEMATEEFMCPCGGLFDIAGLSDEFYPSAVDGMAHGVFRYRKLMPSAVDSHWRQATMGEGWTPIVQLNGPDGILAKMDYMMPTLSFKDRGAVVLMAAAKGSGRREAIQDSSGNAGNSVAAYATRLAIPCEIFVPQSTSPNKVSQIKAYGAKVRLVPGTREDTAAAAFAEAREGRHYASHVFNPLFYQGTKTYIYEIWEQMGGKLPDALALPVGNGTLLLGVYHGLKSLMAGGAIDRFPEVVAVQAENCAPLYRAFNAGADTVGKVENLGTSAEGIAIAAPRRGAQMISVMKQMGGTVVVASEERIEDSARQLAEMGVFVEPTSAATLAGFLGWKASSGFDGSCIIPMCGAGLKSLH